MDPTAPTTALAYFVQELDRCTFAAADGGREVVCFCLLSEWLHSTPPQHAVGDVQSSNEHALNRSWVDLLLNELFHGSASPDLAGKLGDEGHCLKIFCILLKIGIGHQIQNLASLHDGDLPLQRDDLEYYLEALGDQAGAKAAEFCTAQYAFLGKVFGSFPSLLRRFTAPIYHKERIVYGLKAGAESVGSTGTQNGPQMWKIMVPEEFVTPAIREALKGTAAITVSQEGIKVGQPVRKLDSG
jgi:hypothetical protein